MLSATLYRQTNGQSSANTPRKEEGQAREGTRKRVWITEAYPQPGEAERKQQQEQQYILSIENSSQVTKTHTLSFATTQELESFLMEVYAIDSTIIGINFYTAKSGCTTRKQIVGEIPLSQHEVYGKLYLKKHPRIPDQAYLSLLPK